MWTCGRYERNRMMKINMSCMVLLASMFAATADTYPYIITEGYDPAVASTNSCGVAVSAATAFTTRYRTFDESDGTELNARKWCHFSVGFR